MTHYDTLGVTRDASQEEIRKAFRKVMRKHHPDVSNTPQSQKICREVTEAFEILSNKTKKWDYDQSIKSERREETFTSTGGSYHSTRSQSRRQESTYTPPPKKTTVYVPEDFKSGVGTLNKVNFEKVFDYSSMIFGALGVVMMLSADYNFFASLLGAVGVAGTWWQARDFGYQNFSYLFKISRYSFGRFNLPVSLKEYSVWMGLSTFAYILIIAGARHILLTFIFSVIYVFASVSFAQMLARTQEYKKHHSFFSSFESEPTPKKAWKEEHSIVEELVKPFRSIHGLQLVHKHNNSTLVYGSIVHPIKVVDGRGGNIRVERGFVYVDEVIEASMAYELKSKHNYVNYAMYQPIIVATNFANLEADNRVLVVDEDGLLDALNQTIIGNGKQELNETVYMSAFV